MYEPHGGRYPLGPYRADLLIDGQIARSTTFTVAPTVAMPTISRFYTSTRKAYDDWAKTPSAPLPRVSTFPAHTRDVAYYFEHSGGGSGLPPIRAYIRDHRGVIVASAVGRPPLNLSAKAYAGHVPAPRAGGYPAGTYTLSLLINGQAVQKSATFTIPPRRPAAHRSSHPSRRPAAHRSSQPSGAP
jgi:hypothetical protein